MSPTKSEAVRTSTSQPIGISTMEPEQGAPSPPARMVGGLMSRGRANVESMVRNLDAQRSPTNARGGRCPPASASPILGSPVRTGGNALVPLALGPSAVSASDTAPPVGETENRSTVSSVKTRRSMDPDGVHSRDGINQSIQRREREQHAAIVETIEEMRREHIPNRENRTGQQEPEESTTSGRSSCGMEPPPASSVVMSAMQADLPSAVTQDHDDRPHGSRHPACEPITVTIQGSKFTIRPHAEGFDHPHRRGWTGPDQSMNDSVLKHCAVKVGHHPGMHCSFAGAWVRTADFRHDTGVQPVFRGFRTCADAVDFLGCDPDPGETDPSAETCRPPPWAPDPLNNFSCDCGPDPHAWGQPPPQESSPCPPADPATVTADVPPSADTSSLSAGGLETQTIDESTATSSSESTKGITAEQMLNIVGNFMKDFHDQHGGNMPAEVKQENLHRKQLADVKPEHMPSLEKTPDAIALGKWKAMMEATLSTPKWAVDHASILSMPDDGVLDDDVKIRNQILSSLLVQMLTKDHCDIIQDFPDLVKAGRGTSLCHAILQRLHPNSESAALLDFASFVTGVQRNGETATSLGRDLKLQHTRLKEVGFDLGDRALLLQLVRTVLQGACGGTKELETFSTDILHKKLKLSEETFETLSAKVHDVMSGGDLVVNGAAERLPGAVIARRMNGGSFSQPGRDNLHESAWTGQMELSDPEIKLVFKATKCPVCRIPGGREGEHQIDDCPVLKQRGICGMCYDKSMDKALEERMRKGKGGDVKPPPSGSPSPSAPEKARVAQDNKATEGETKVGSANRVVGQANRVNASSPDPFEPLFEDVHADSSDIKEFDSEECVHTLCDKLTAGSSHRKQKCIGACCKVNGQSTRSNDNATGDTVVADSGATSDVFRERRHFGDDHRPCRNACVAMGDGTEVPVAGTGTPRFKIDGKAIELPNGLHVPRLDCNLLSIARHGLRGQGCTFFAGDGAIHLSFPDFHLSRTMPPDGDPRFMLEPLSKTDEGFCDFSGGVLFNPFGDGARRMAFLKKMHEARAVTRSQRKKFIENQKRVVKSVFVSCPAPKSADATDPLSEIERGSTEPDLRGDIDAATRDTASQQRVESARGKSIDKCTSYELETMFGGRCLKDCSLLSSPGTGIKVTDRENEIPTMGKLVNRKRGRRNKTRSPVLEPNSIAGMDIGCGPAASPGGHKCALVLVDCCTSNSWAHGMKGTSGADTQEALWRFFIEAQGFPQKIQCDFDPRFLGGQAKALLQSHGCTVEAAPPDRQSQNGMAEKRWQTLAGMARSFLADARLPTEFWCWAIREAVVRLNALPVTSKSKEPTDPKCLTTPHEAFHGAKPDYRMLFPFGCAGGFRRPRDGPHKRNEFASQGMMGTALGRSEHTNGMIFCNPTPDSFSTSADCCLDRQLTVNETFPSLTHDGGPTASIWSNRADSPTKFTVGETVLILDQSQSVQSGAVTMPPATLAKSHTIQPDGGTMVTAPPDQICTECTAPATGLPSETLGFFTPQWMRQGVKVTCMVEDECKQGCLNLDKDCFWEFVARGHDGRIAERVPLPDLHCSWKERALQNTLQTGWEDNTARRVFGIGRHVSAAALKSTMAPANLMRGLAESNPDSFVWRQACDEEHNGLAGLDTFAEMDEEECQRLVKEHGEKAEAIPTMNAFTVKKNEESNPVRAKSRVAVLGNLERRLWDKCDRCAPVINASANRLPVSMAVEKGRCLKQGDCKSAFCQPTLPEDEITMVKPPKGCPRSKPGTRWRLKKTLCGLSRSPRHWHDTLSGTSTKKLGFKAMDQDKCVFECTPFADKPPVCLGMHVDDFVCFSESDEVEQWFEQGLGSELEVDFMGPVSWFLGCHHDWHTLEDGRVTCHVSQQAFVEQLSDKFGMTDCTPSPRPCRQGLTVDRVDRDDLPKENHKEFVQQHQSLMGGLTWLVISARPDISVATKLLSQFNSKPSPGHMESGKHLLRHSKHTSSHGIWFTQGERRLHSCVAFPEEVDPDEVIDFTDSDWGAQDASKPRENETRTVRVDELNSLQGHHIARVGGAVLWGVNREPGISGSSCEAETKAMDDGAKSIQCLRHLMTQIGLIDSEHPVPLPNDDRGAVDWANNGGIIAERLRHANIREGRVVEAQQHGEIEVCWIPGTDDPADSFTKEHRDISHFCKCRDLMVRPREWIHQGCDPAPHEPVSDSPTIATIKAKKEATKAAKKARRAQRIADRLQVRFDSAKDKVICFGAGNGGPPIGCSLNQSALTPLSSLRTPMNSMKQ